MNMRDIQSEKGVCTATLLEALSPSVQQVAVFTSTTCEQTINEERRNLLHSSCFITEHDVEDTPQDLQQNSTLATLQT